MEQVSDSFVLTTTYGPRLTGCGAGSNNMKVGQKPSALDVQPYPEGSISGTGLTPQDETGFLATLGRESN
jgi:hypothetical protein